MKKLLPLILFLSIFGSLYPKSLRIFKTENPPVIDGKITANDNWSDDWQNLNQAAISNITNAMTAKFQMKYDEAFLYILVLVNDAYKDSSSLDAWENDCVQLYLAMDTNSYFSGVSSIGNYKTGDFQFRKEWAKNLMTGYIGGSDTTFDKWILDNSTLKVAETYDEQSYIQEWQIPWHSLVREILNSWSRKDFKFDIQATDRTSLGRTQLQFWNSNSDEQWNNTSYLGYVVLDSAIYNEVIDTFTPPRFIDQICQITVDKSTGKNLVQWSPTNVNSIKEYCLYKETSVRNVFDKIATIPYADAGSYVDISSSPEKHADRYKMETLGYTGIPNGTSKIHQTIHLVVAQGNPGYYNLIWSHYNGFDFATYYIYRGKSANNLVLIDSISSNRNQYSDKIFGKVYYRVGVRSNYPCYSTNQTLLKSLVFGKELDNMIVISNVESIDGNGINDLNSLPFKATPNPFVDQVTISSEISNAKVTIEIFNALGKRIYSFTTNELVNGYFEHVINSKDLQKATEICIIKVSAGTKIGYSKLIKR